MRIIKKEERMDNCDIYLLHLPGQEPYQELHPDIEQIYKKYSKYILKYSCRFFSEKEDAENVVHDTFIAFMESYDRFDTSREVLPYLYSIARNKCISILRKRSVRSQKDMLTLIAVEHEPSPNIYGMDIRSLLYKALAQMAPKVRTTFLMSRMHGMTHKEIALSLGISERGVEERMKKAMLELRKVFKDYL